MTRSIKIELPENLFQQLQRTAELSRLPVAAIVEQSLTHSLPLRREADALTFRKAYAAVLLKRRGHQILTIDDLPPVQ